LKWAGTYRKTERNIGCDPKEIVQRIPQSLDNTRYWLENKTFSNDEALLRFHHQLTKIHPFANGNGRHARMIADVVAVKYGQAEFTWGAGKTLSPKGMRERGISPRCAHSTRMKRCKAAARLRALLAETHQTARQLA